MDLATMAHGLLFSWFLLADLLVSVCSVSVDRSIHIVHMDKTFMPNVFASHHHWYSSIIDSVRTVGPMSSRGRSGKGPELVYSYDHAFHGFSAMMSKDELEALKSSSGFVSAYADKIVTIDTTHSFEFLGLNPDSGLWPLSEYGKDTIVAVVDSGIWPEHPSFRDDGMSKTPSRWKGKCQEGQEFNSSLCNLKLIGAQYFNKAVKAANPNLNLSMDSARDTTGHGTHVAGIVAGNYVEGASFFGYARGTARGVAPRAKLAVYKVLWDEGNWESDVIAGIDQAVADGVDVISLSLGFGPSLLYEDSIAIAAFGAMETGVFVSCSAGNRGTDIGRLHNAFPWGLTVAAGTIDRFFAGTLTMTNGVTITGWTMYPENAIIKNVEIVYNKNISACNSTELLSDSVNGVIICDDIGNFREQIDLIARSPWRAAVFISDDPSIFRSTYFPHPGIVINPRDAPKLIESLTGKDTFVQATIRFQQTTVGRKPAPVVSSSSSRGPAPSNPGILKPDILAPGVLILSAYAPDSFTAFITPNIVLSNDYNAMSGTSMACPHASGIAAMIKSVHPKWSPAAIRSAMMTTANPLDNTNSSIKDMALNYEVASPLAIGAGHIDPNRAISPGLVYDATPQDYVNYICSMNFSQAQVSTVTRSDRYNCRSPSSDLNYPSFIALYSVDGRRKGQLVQSFKRTVTNVGDGAATYKAKLISPTGSIVKVSPETLVFKKKNEKQSYSLSIRYSISEDFTVTFGSLTWIESSGKYTVRSPIVVSYTVSLD